MKMKNDQGKSIPIEQIIYRYFVKYARLNQLIPVAYKGSNATRLNIFIDIYGLYKTICSRSYRTSTTDFTSFTSTIINMCSHYREYFKQIGVYTKIFLISSFNIPEANGKFVAGYNKTMIDKLKNNSVMEIVNMNIDLLNLLCPYLPDIHFIHTTVESSTMIAHIIDLEKSKGNNNPNMIISSDIYPIQLCIKYPQTTLLHPKKYMGEDLSEIVCPRESDIFYHSFWGTICKKDRDSLENAIDSIRISPVNFSLLETLNRFPERNLKLIYNVKVAERIIYDVVGSENTKISLESLYNISKELSVVPYVTLESRYKVIDLDYQLSLFKNSVESLTVTYDNLNDPEAVQMINSQYFQSNPIDLFRL